ncbi:FAD-dependent oxidoreductase [Streptosporangiaceae bacterium NEAU-GS5]|nr:FAD-dependent oxidoreductase [Streptosporangiaceae bacterium NEAU-GS5]
MSDTTAYSTTTSTTCVIAGGGPAGAMLGLLLARAGIDVTLLEKHADFLRDFRGDTIHPSTLQLLDELGLKAEFDKLPHQSFPRVAVETGEGLVSVADFTRLPGRYREITMVPQWDFLNLITKEATRYPNFRLLMQAEATGVLRAGDKPDSPVTGLRYRDAEGEHEIRAALTVAADGRHSDVRDAVGMTPVEMGAPMDVVWFRLPREDTDPDETFFRPGVGNAIVMLNRRDYWQLAYVIPKNGFAELERRGVEELRATLDRLLPFLSDRTDQVRLADVSVLSVAVNRLRRWHLPGLLIIGDAAHAMSPIGGVGINLAIQDAVAAANLLDAPLRKAESNRRPVLDPVPDSLLARLQRRRTFPTAATQWIQVQVQNRLITRILAGETPPDVGTAARRIPVTAKRLAARAIGIGFRPEHVRSHSVDRGAMITDQVQ